MQNVCIVCFLDFVFYLFLAYCECFMLLDGEHSAGFLNDLGVKIEDITFFEGGSE